MIGLTPDLTSVRAARYGVLELAFEDGVAGTVDIADRLWGPAFAHASTPDGFFDVAQSVASAFKVGPMRRGSSFL